MILCIPKTEQEILDLLKANDKVILQFSAEWCGPCRGIRPAVETLADMHKDVKFVYIDIDNFGNLASSHGIASVPTFLSFKNGKQDRKLAGADRTALEHIVQDLKDSKMNPGNCSI